MQQFVVMGVSGCGKTTVATALAAQLPARFIEADQLHGSANIEKMKSGQPLTDEDRWPWLQRVAEDMRDGAAPVVVSCSALRRAYREFLIEKSGAAIAFIHLHAEQQIIQNRMQQRAGHFMPVALLDSQFAALEPLAEDECGVVVDIAPDIDKVNAAALAYAQTIVGQ